jgi:cell division protein FtsI (penicillin-binding protein 3)
MRSSNAKTRTNSYVKAVKTAKTVKQRPDRIRIRLISGGCIISILFAVISARAVQIQVLDSEWLQEKASKQYERPLVVKGKRGAIMDSNLEDFATTINVTSIAVHPKQVKDRAETARIIAKTTGMDYKEVKNKLDSSSSFVWIKRQALPKHVDALREMNIKGLVFLPEETRIYPHTDMAAQLVGFSGLDGKGLGGLEYHYDSELQGKSAQQKVLRDAKGRFIERPQGETEATNGNNLILTIDRTIQYITDNSLKAAVEQYNAKSGIAVVMDPKSGAILALSNYPVFNPNNYRSYDRSLLRNRAVTDPFEPGSTMKIFLAAAAFESGIVKPETKFNCENGKYRVDSFIIHDTHSHGSLTVGEIIKYSSNIGSVKISEAIGKESLYKSLKNFGFGEKTGIDCPGESPGRLANQSKWRKIDFANIAFGQGVSVSAVQLTAAVSALANKGIMMKPRLVRAITDSENNIVKIFEPEKIGRAVSEKTADEVKKIMREVATEGGTGKNADIEGYPVCGKTGTAQKIDESGRYAKGKYVSSFVGFAPMDDPQLTTLVLLDEPSNGGYYGGTVAAPAFREIVSQSLQKMSLYPLLTEEKLVAALKERNNG